MHRLTILFTACVAAFTMTALAQSARPSQQASQNPVPSQRSAPREAPRAFSVDGDQAYKANCLRCHAEPRKFRQREMVTIMRHMRVRGNLTEDETGAILQYLTR